MAILVTSSATFVEGKEESKSQNERRFDLVKSTEAYNLSRSELEYIINQWIFNEKHRAILSDRLFSCATFERLAEKYDLSTRQVKNIVYKAMDKLEKHL